MTNCRQTLLFGQKRFCFYLLLKYTQQCNPEISIPHNKPVVCAENIAENITRKLSLLTKNYSYCTGSPPSNTRSLVLFPLLIVRKSYTTFPIEVRGSLEWITGALIREYDSNTCGSRVNHENSQVMSEDIDSETRSKLR